MAMYREKGKMWDQIGEYLLCSPPVPSDKSGFLNAGRMRASEQFFEHTDLPTPELYESWDEDKQQELADQERDRRTNGVWFMNNGVPTWIPGQYYFFLNYHRFKGTKPQYRDCHRQLYWVWVLFVLINPNCLGLFLHTRRRWGKTACAANIGWEAASGTKFFRVGIQSKTEDDSKALFLNEVRDQCMEMLVDCPWFYQHTSGSNKPNSELIFDKPASRAKGAAKDKDARGGLKSKIDWRESTNTAYDSQGLDYFINDEVGKKQIGDPWARHSIVSKQFYPSGPVVGKEFAMTTSDENDDDSVAKAKEFWDNSDPAKLAQRKGLARLFFPDIQGFECDKYGFDTQKSIDDLNAARAAAEAEGIVSWIRHRRAYPRTIEEAHLPSAKVDCHFNQAHIGDVMTAIAEYNAERPATEALVKRYNIEGEPGKLYFTESSTGVFYMPWIPPAEWLNKIRQVGTVQTALGMMPRYKPEGTKFSTSADPFDNTTTLEAGSKGALHGAYEWDTKMEDMRGQPGYWPSHSFFVEYAERPDDPDTYYNHGLLLCMILGCKCFCETNKVNFEKHFRKMGCADFLARPPVATMSEAVKQVAKAAAAGGVERTGQASSPRAIEEYMKAKKTFYQKYVGTHKSHDSVGNPYGQGFNDEGLPYDFRRMPFLRTLDQDLRFNPADPHSRKTSDLSVSHGFGLVNMTGFTIKPKEQTSSKGLTLAGVRGMLRGMYR
jgi:hypothetical protein